MPAKIFRSQYKDQNAITIENENLAFQFLPDIGAKLASILDKNTNREFMVQRTNPEYLLQPYDGTYVNGECSGFDDMFPTIDECYYEKYPWQGTRIPDHGEVWSLPWHYELTDNQLYTYVFGVRFPYKLEKRIQFRSAKTLHIHYELTNLSNFDFDFMWAAHMMINLEENVSLLVPPDVNRAICTMSKSGRIGRYGDEFSWPEFTAPDGTRHRADRLRPKQTDDCEKYFFKDKLTQGWCALQYPGDHTVFALSFPAAEVPYLGILPNEGGWNDLHNIFLEPCTAPLDRIDVARMHGKISTVKANSRYTWYLNITIDKMNVLKGIDEDGNLF